MSQPFISVLLNLQKHALLSTRSMPTPAAYRLTVVLIVDTSLSQRTHTLDPRLWCLTLPLNYDKHAHKKVNYIVSYININFIIIWKMTTNQAVLFSVLFYVHRNNRLIWMDDMMDVIKIEQCTRSMKNIRFYDGKDEKFSNMEHSSVYIRWVKYNYIYFHHSHRYNVLKYDYILRYRTKSLIFQIRNQYCRIWRALRNCLVLSNKFIIPLKRIYVLWNTKLHETGIQMKQQILFRTKSNEKYNTWGMM